MSLKLYSLLFVFSLGELIYSQDLKHHLYSENSKYIFRSLTLNYRQKYNCLLISICISNKYLKLNYVLIFSPNLGFPSLFPFSVDEQPCFSSVRYQKSWGHSFTSVFFFYPKYISSEDSDGSLYISRIQLLMPSHYYTLPELPQ